MADDQRATNPDGSLSIADVRHRTHNARANTPVGRYLERALTELEAARNVAWRLRQSHAELLAACEAAINDLTGIIHPDIVVERLREAVHKAKEVTP